MLSTKLTYRKSSIKIKYLDFVNVVGSFALGNKF